MNEFYRFRAEAGEEPTSAELMIFDVIGNWEEIGEISAKGFAKALAELPQSVKRLDIHINSPGGSLFDASAIYSRLADHPSQKHVYIDGLAASAATIVAMVGHKIFIRANANMMIHLPSGLAIGNAHDMRKVATALDTITESMVNVYNKRTGQERDQIRSWLDAETWMSPEQAVERGFADEVRGVVKAAAMTGENRAMFNGIEFDLSRFRNRPAFSGQQTEETPTMPKPNKPKVRAEETPTPPETETPETTTEQPTPPESPPAQPAAPPEQPAAPAAAAASDYERGVNDERARVAALQALDRPATHEIVANAIKDGKKASDIVAQIVDAMDKAGKQTARHADATVLSQIPGSDGGDTVPANNFGASIKSRVRARMKGRRGERPVHSRN